MIARLYLSTSGGHSNNRPVATLVAVLSATALVLAGCADKGTEGMEATFNPGGSATTSSRDAVASSSQTDSAETDSAQTDSDDTPAGTADDCANNTLATSGLHAEKIPSYTTYPYSYKIVDNGYDPCAPLSFVHLQGVFADEREVTAWESPTSTVIYFHQGKIIKNPAPEMYYLVDNPRQADDSTVTFDLKAPGAEYYSPQEDGGSVTATFSGGGLEIDQSEMRPNAASDMRIDLS